ncbi:MAG: Gfo/Idh/MocA family oxidoreductase [Chitinophagaceae bacterium]|nr:Gfo/Idh/MocA family oxidoreductase [Chitinophagaceae bacterium]
MQPINTAICSFGMSGWVFHAPFISTHPGFRFYAVWVRSKNLAQEKYPEVKVYRTLEELVADELVELVVVNTPNTTHYDFAKQALLADKHVICEKPFTATVAEAEELIQNAAKQNKQLSVFQNRRYDSDYRTIKKVLEEKLLGDIVEAEFHFDRYKEELSPKQHKETPIPGTGCLYDLGSHLIDQALQLFGMPQAVFADIAVMRPVSKVDDYFELLLYYPVHRVRVKASYQVREALPGYIIHGSKGSFIKPKTDMQEEQLQSGMLPTEDGYGIEPESEKGLLHSEINGKIIKEYIPSLKGNYTDYYEGVYQAIRNNQPPPVTAEDGMKVIKIIEAAFQSSKERRVIDL